MHEAFPLSEALVDAVAAARPSLATFMGVSGHDDRWEDLSPDGDAARAALLTAFAGVTDELEDATDPSDKLALSVLRDYLRLECDAVEHGDSRTDLNILSSPPQLLPMALDAMDATSALGKASIAARLRGLSDALAGYRRTLATGLDNDQRVAARQVEAVAAQADTHAGPNSALRALGIQVGDSDAGVAAAKAYHELALWLRGRYMPEAADEEAFGEERYARAARRFLGCDLDLAETYRWGWTEVAAIAEQLREVAAVVAPGKSVNDTLEYVRTEASLASADRAEFIAAMTERQQRAFAAVEGEFTIPEQLHTLDVKLAPPGGAPGAYYVPPAEDFSRPGTIWYSLPNEAPVPLFDQVSTAYHEGFPGHHLQCGLQVALADKLSRLHRVAYGYSGFAEGWALYAEQRMDELGQYEDPSNQLGMWSNQMARACRVVVDIGFHLGLRIPDDAVFHPGESWSFGLAVEMMHKLGGLSVERSRSEVTRYFGWPGQAISYKVGQRAMLSLRDRWTAANGPDLRVFHERVLSTGNVGLDQLDALVLQS